MLANVRKQQLKSGIKLLNIILNVQNFLYVLVMIDIILNPNETWLFFTPPILIGINIFIQNCASNDPNWLPLLPLILSSINTTLILEWELQLKTDTIYMLPQW